MEINKIIKEKLKEIEKKYKQKVLRIEDLKKDKVILIDTYGWRDFKKEIKESFFSGMQTAIKSELEWLKLHRESDNACFNLKNLKPKSKKLEEGYKASLKCQVEIYDKRITDCKNALKLIEEKWKKY